jgi:N-methylhydantoinase A
MGGTTAKICLIEDFKPKTARTFEVARTYRFSKGSGMPISIPVIEMIEIGAGGGSIAWTDAMGRIQTGPESAGSEPGPACYQRGGQDATITDADLVLGRLDPDNFAGGAITLSVERAELAIEKGVGSALHLDCVSAAFGINEVVDENMANAARVHAVENGKDISANVMIAFGGAAPLHASRLCEKLGIKRCFVPTGAGVGSAIGFLKAPFSYEALASRPVRLTDFDVSEANDLLATLTETAESFVRPNTTRTLHHEIVAYMRYAGQGWEIPVALLEVPLAPDASATLKSRFGEAYSRFFGRTIDGLEGLEVEIVTWSVRVTEALEAISSRTLKRELRWLAAPASRPSFDPGSGRMVDTAIVERSSMIPGDAVHGPAVVVERETSTVVTSSFDAVMQEDGGLLIVRKDAH